MSDHGKAYDPLAIRAQLDHPVVDSDGHYMEFMPVFREQFVELSGQLGGSALQARIADAPDLRGFLLSHTSPIGQAFGASTWGSETPAERMDNWTPVPGWGPPHSHALDRATALVPKLRAERLVEIGIDFSVLYPSSALIFPHIEDEELRQVTCRAVNTINAEAFHGVRSQMTPAALIPMMNPDEAIAELDHAISELGLKVAMIGSVARPIPSIHRSHPELYNSVFRLDSLGIDSPYDYDPFWAHCEALRVPLVSHGGNAAVGWRRSPSNYIFNQTGCFAEAAEVLCRSLFLGGVTRRFPSLKFQFLECGAGWACTLYAELVHRWEKRNRKAIRGLLEASQASGPEFMRLLNEHGGDPMRRKLEDLPHGILLQLGTTEPPDDFAACQIESVEDIAELFVDRFYFGCEADDPSAVWAFDTGLNPGGARLRALLGSDMGHWDVPDAAGILPEAWEMVEHGRMSSEDFRRFTFEHPAEFFGVNPRFFDGTAVEPYIKERAL
jgi:predicted TIM-barrel fold metal-dependent hydrolase